MSPIGQLDAAFYSAERASGSCLLPQGVVRPGSRPGFLGEYFKTLFKGLMPFIWEFHDEAYRRQR